MKPITVDFFQFSRSLNEWLDDEVILKYQAEIFSLYAASYSVEQVARILGAKEANSTP
jgi:hypothetical protein